MRRLTCWFLFFAATVGEPSASAQEDALPGPTLIEPTVASSAGELNEGPAFVPPAENAPANIDIQIEAAVEDVVAGFAELAPILPAEYATDRQPVALTPAEQQLHDYLYVTYPQYVQLLVNRIALAQAHVDVLQARVKAYRPFATFHQYSPTWTAEQDSRLALLAAEQDLATLKRIEADLWIYHRANIARLAAVVACAGR